MRLFCRMMHLASGRVRRKPIMVNQKNKQTFSAPRVGEVSNLAGAECTVNSKVYHKSSCPKNRRTCFTQAFVIKFEGSIKTYSS